MKEIIMNKENILTKLMEAAKVKRQNKNFDVSKCKDWKEFILRCYQKNPQSYGAAIEKRFIEFNGMKKVPAKEDKGDIIEFGEYKEIKASISDTDNYKFNVVQIRPHQDISSYYFLFFEIDSNGNTHKHIFEVPKKQIMNIKGLGLAHGTKEKKQINQEYRVTIKKESEDWNFLEQFRVTKEF